MRYSLTINNRTARFVHKYGEDFSTALSRGASKLGFRGGAFTQPNFEGNRLVTVCDRTLPGNNSRQSYTGVCCPL